MFGLSNVQLLGQLRLMLTTLGTIITMLGFSTQGVVDNWIAATMNFAGAALVLGMMIWSAIDKMRSSLIKNVDDIAQDKTQPMAIDAKAALLTAVSKIPEVSRDIQIAPVNSTLQAKQEAAALNEATPNAVVMSPVPQS